MKYIAIIDADEKPVCCEFIGCNGNVTPYLIGSTTNIKALEQDPTTKKCTTCIYREIGGKPHKMCKSCVCGNRYRQEPKTDVPHMTILEHVEKV